MDVDRLIELLPSTKGVICTIETHKLLPLLKKFVGEVEVSKASVFQLRIGHSYYAQATTRNAHESGQRAVANPDSLWHCQSELHPALRVNKKNPAKLYLAGQPIKFPHPSLYFKDGVNVEFEEIKPFIRKVSSSQKSDHLMIAVETITAFNSKQ